MADTPLPAPFTARLKADMGPREAAALIEALDTAPVVSIRFNPYKVGEKPQGEQVPWSRYGFYLDERPLFTLDPLFHAGAYYVQEASSMFMEWLFRDLFAEGERLKILDMCAAPGGKTTHLSALAGLESVVVANEPIRQRANVLSENVRKWGLGNVIVTNNDPSHFAPLKGFFDLVAVDAPCSGEGMFRKDPASRGQWSPSAVELCASRQRRILADAWETVADGGVLIYSTCTFNRRENEDNIEWLVEEYGAQAVSIGELPDPGIVRGKAAGIDTFRFYPHRVRGEGFFVAAVRKPEGSRRKEQLPRPRRTMVADLPKAALPAVTPWFGQPEYMRFGLVGGERVFGYYENAYRYIDAVAGNLSVIYSGVEAGQVIKGKLKPEHSLALFHDVSREVVPSVCLGLADALKYLRKDELPPELFEEGVNMVEYGGLPTGWIKRIGNRCNNMYPVEWRILKTMIND